MLFDGSPSVSNQVVIEALRRGRERVACGWCQGTLYKFAATCNGGYGAMFCAVGALTEGAADPLAAPGMRQLLGAINCAHPAALARWNDVPGRQKSEVVGLYDRAIEAALAAEAR